MFDAFPYDEWSETVTDFWTFGGANSTGTYILTALGFIVFVASLLGWIWLEHTKLQRQATMLRATGAFEQPGAPPPPPPERGGDVDKQIDFDPMQKEVRWLTPFMLGLSLVCAAIVIIVLLTDFDGAFIGPWG
jgi:hypothetical protein